MLRIKLMIGMALVATAVSAPTSSNAALEQCLSNKMCIWGHNDYVWLLAAQIHGQSGWLDVFNDGAYENNQNDSWANRSSTYTGCMASELDGGGTKLTMQKVTNDPNMAFFYSDIVDSMRTMNGC